MADTEDKRTLEQIGQDVAALRERVRASMPPEDPIHGLAFRLHALVGKAQAITASCPAPEGEPQ